MEQLEFICEEQQPTRLDKLLTEFLPEYEKYGRSAPLKRNLLIINYADEVIAFWDGASKGTKYVIDNCKKMDKKIDGFINGGDR